jgi:DNA-binding beta-propeller fold protein YncE
LAADGSLYVADTLENRIIAIPNAVNRSSSDGNGTNLSNVSVLNDPLGLAIRPDNGDILVTNCNNGMLVVLSSTGNMKSTGFARSRHVIRTGYQYKWPVLCRRWIEYSQTTD